MVICLPWSEAQSAPLPPCLVEASNDQAYRYTVQGEQLVKRSKEEQSSMSSTKCSFDRVALMQFLQGPNNSP